MIADIQPGEVVVAEKIDRISRLPLAEAEQLVGSIRAKGVRLAVPGIVDLSDVAAAADGVAKIVLESVQDMLLKLALQMARDEYETVGNANGKACRLPRMKANIRVGFPIRQLIRGLLRFARQSTRSSGLRN